jgi:hypothetical protein
VALISDRTGRVEATEDENGDGVIDRQDDLYATRRVEADTADAPTTTGFDRDDSGVIATTPVGPRPRASMLATLSLIVGVVAGLAVLSGQFAAPGVGLGAIAALLSVGGLAATGRRYVAGKGDALLGLVFGLAAIVIGVLSLSGTLPWLTSHTDNVANLHQWLQTHASWLFPN